MSATPKHTPGPWTVEQRDVVSLGNAYEEVGPVLVFAGDQRVATCETYTAADEDAPNARLIAAAPDLAEALGLCVVVLGRVGDGKHAESAYAAHAYGLARAALAKAGVS